MSDSSRDLPLYVDGRKVWMSVVNQPPEKVAEIVSLAPKSETTMAHTATGEGIDCGMQDCSRVAEWKRAIPTGTPRTVWQFRCDACRSVHPHRDEFIPLEAT